MKRKDIQYFNSWEKCFKNCSPAQVMQALINGIWISSNRDPDDIYLVFPRLIIKRYREIAEVGKQFGACPFEFAIDDSETYDWGGETKEVKHKGRDINSFGASWHLDKYEMRKAVTEQGLEAAKYFKITKEEIVALHKKHGWDDYAMYQDLINNRPDLWYEPPGSQQRFCNLFELTFKDIRAAFCPHCDTIYNWMDYPEKAGIAYPNIDQRDAMEECSKGE